MEPCFDQMTTAERILYVQELSEAQRAELRRRLADYEAHARGVRPLGGRPGAGAAAPVSLPLRIRPEATAEQNEAWNWYEER